MAGRPCNSNWEAMTFVFALEVACLQEEDGVSYEDYRGPQTFVEPLVRRARSVYGGHCH